MGRGEMMSLEFKLIENQIEAASIFPDQLG